MFPLRPKTHWGPALWSFLHTITVIDHEESSVRHTQVDSVLMILQTLVTPCYKCTKHWKEFMESLSELNIYDRMALFHAVWAFHNTVNVKLGKPEIPYDAAVRTWCRDD